MSSNHTPYTSDEYWDDYLPDEVWYAEDTYLEADPEEWAVAHPEPLPLSPLWNGWTVVGIALILIFFYAAFANNRTVTKQIDATPESVAVAVESVGDTAVSSPYPQYTLTQGPHGQSYGQLAIDIAAGRGEPILSPINGQISERYIDEYNSPTLVIENEVYIVTFLHGDYSAQVGDTLKMGDPIGIESNKGYTMDMQGNLCYEREYCGNHSHLNIYDKRQQANVNPLNLISNTPTLSH